MMTEAECLNKNACLRPALPEARVVAIIGGGFTGLMALANLLRFAHESAVPFHVVLIDRQPAAGEGVAYRTTDARHLLNVPAGNMSAWPDSPEHFLAFARSQDSSVGSYDFLPRRIYGQYVRETMLALAEAAGDKISVEMIQDEVERLAPLAASGWSIATSGGRSLDTDVAILAVGHRPPNDPLANKWTGPRTRCISDPWDALALSQIGHKDSVLLIGSGLTAVDVILTLERADRVAPIIAISRRGLSPMAHLRERKKAADLSELLERWMDPAAPLTIRQLCSSLRQYRTAAQKAGMDWQQVIDGLRGATPLLWQRLSSGERSRFLRHLRPFWEVHRHRTAPAIADTMDRLRSEKKFDVVAGSVIAATADSEGVEVTFSPRGASNTRTVRVGWVVNCTGPGVHSRHATHPFLRPLMEEGVLCGDDLSLGLLTDDDGRAIGENGAIHSNLLVAGTLRKATLWESTAVPELRQQAQSVARAAIAALSEVGS